MLASSDGSRCFIFAAAAAAANIEKKTVSALHTRTRIGAVVGLVRASGTFVNRKKLVNLSYGTTAALLLCPSLALYLHLIHTLNCGARGPRFVC